MKDKLRTIITIVTIVLLGTILCNESGTISSFAESPNRGQEISVRLGGCGAYQLKKRGKSYCSDTYCPGGNIRRRLRNDLYAKKCVYANNKVKTKYMTKTEFVKCDCD